MRASRTPDRIVIDGLELRARIGVPDEERAQAQRLTANVTLQPRRSFGDIEDRIKNAVDYHRVCDAIQAVAASGERRLLETLAEEIALALLHDFPLAAVEIELRKFILPQTQFVAVHIHREASEPFDG